MSNYSRHLPGKKPLEIEMSIIGYVHRDPCRVCVSETLVSAVNTRAKDHRHLFKVFFFIIIMG